MTSLAYRSAVSSDMPMVVATWADSFRTSRSAGLISMEDWLTVMVPQVRRVLARPGVAVHVACHPGEDDRRSDLYGWIAWETDYSMPAVLNEGGRHERALVKADVPLVHFVYVKSPYRRMGIARGLFRSAGVGDRFNYTCNTAVLSKLRDKISRAAWTPLVARHPKNEPRRTDGERISGEGRTRG